jgi:hypothetical protein
MRQRQRNNAPLSQARRILLLLRCLSIFGLLLLGGAATAQTVQPVIVEYQGKASGKFELSNHTLTPMAVVLEPKSFSITPDGNGVYRELDPDIHLELSAMSFRLDPGQTYYVFYKARADKLPAWFTVYAVFSSLKHDTGIDVRVLLPHTVYLYQKQRLDKEDIALSRAVYSGQAKEVTCDLHNTSPDLGRVQQIRVIGGHTSATAAGFPMLPGDSRHVELKWEGATPPQKLEVEFQHFTLQQTLTAGDK